MRVLATGATGFIGSWVVDRASSSQPTVDVDQGMGWIGGWLSRRAA